MIRKFNLLKILSSTPPLRRGRFFLAKKRKATEEIKKKIPQIEKINLKNLNLTVIRQPNYKSIDFLSRNFNFHPLHIEDIQSVQRPKIDFEEDYIFFVMHFPEYNSKTRKIESKEIDIFMTENDVLVITNSQFSPLETIIAKIGRNDKEQEQYFEKGTGFLAYTILDTLVDSIFPLLSQIEKAVEQVDSEIFSEQARSIVEDISFLRRNVIFFQTLIKPELNSFSRVETEQHCLLDEDTKDYFANISDHLKKIWDRLEDIKELTDNLSTTFESYFSFRTNEAIKVLTIFSVILLPLTLLSGIYGMNLSFLPFANHPFALLIIGGFMIGMIGTMLTIFKVNKWI